MEFLRTRCVSNTTRYLEEMEELARDRIRNEKGQ